MTALRSPFRRFIPLLGGAALLAVAAAPAGAATIVVSSVIDGFSPTDGCSLREALVNANTDSKLGSVECVAGAGADTIVLPPRSIQVQGSSADEDDPLVGDIDITSDITFLGGGAQFSILEAYYGGRIFDVQAGGSLTVRGVLLQRGYAEDAGGAIRVKSGGTLLVDDVVISSSKISDALGVAGKGAAIYGGSGASVTVTRSQIGYNTALDDLGAGAGIYCDGCVLDVSHTTFNDNKAGYAGGALFAAASSQVTLRFNTFGFNQAPRGAALDLWSDATLTGVLAADNSYAGFGDDVRCNAGTFTADWSFLEYPDAACTLGTGSQSRAWVTASSEANLLQEGILQRFDGQPSGILQWRIPFFQVPVALCPGYADQHRRAPATGSDCDIGAFVRPAVGVNPMVEQWSTNSAPVLMGVRVFSMPAVDTVVRVHTLGGIGEACSVAVPDVTIAAGNYTGSYLLDPDSLFAGPALDREYRVCEFELEVVSGDPQLVGAKSGVLRIKLHDTTLLAAAGVSAPKPGDYLDFGSVPVATGGDASIFFLPDVAGWDITGVSFGGSNADKFTSLLAPGDFPLAVKTRAEGGTPLPFHCEGGALADYDATIQVTTSNPSFPTLIYGVRCRVAHRITLMASDNLVAEAGGGSVDFTVRLDSPSILPGPFTVKLVDAGGTATSGADYTQLPDAYVLDDTGTWSQDITFNPGDSEHTVSVSIFDDMLIEDTEHFSMLLVLPPTTQVTLSGTGSAKVVIDNDDVPYQDMTVQITGVPERTKAGVRVPAQVTVTNIGTDPLVGLSVGMDVDAPVRVIAFGIGNASCSVADDRRSGHCTFPNGVVREGQVDARVRPARQGSGTVAYVPGWFPGADGTVSSVVFSDGTTPVTLAPSDYTLTINADGSGLLALAPTTFGGTGAFPANGTLTLGYLHPLNHVRVIDVVLEMAEMRDAPQLDVAGSVTASASSSAGSQALSVDDRARYVIAGKGVNMGSLPAGSLLVLLLLALRRAAGRPVGRKARRDGCQQAFRDCYVTGEPGSGTAELPTRKSRKPSGEEQ